MEGASESCFQVYQSHILKDKPCSEIGSGEFVLKAQNLAMRRKMKYSPQFSENSKLAQGISRLYF